MIRWVVCLCEYHEGGWYDGKTSSHISFCIGVDPQGLVSVIVYPCNQVK